MLNLCDIKRTCCDERKESLAAFITGKRSPTNATLSDAPDRKSNTEQITHSRMIERFKRLFSNIDAKKDIIELKRIACVVKNKSMDQKALWQIVLNSAKGIIDPNHASCALTVLNYAGASFVGRQLSGIKVPHAKLCNAVLDDACFDEADLHGACFHGAYFGSCSLRGANITDMKLGFSSIRVGSSCQSRRVCFISSNPARTSSSEGHSLPVGLNSTAEPMNLIAVASDDHNIHVYDVDKMNLVWTLRGHTDYISALVGYCDGDGRRLLASAGWDLSIFVWDLDTGVAIYQLKAHIDWILTMCFLKDSCGRKLLASAGWDHGVIIWDLETGELVRRWEIFTSAIFTLVAIPLQDGNTWLACGGRHHSVPIYDASTGVQVKVILGINSSVMSLCLTESHDGDPILVGACSDKVLRVWSLSSLDLIGKSDVQTQEMRCLYSMIDHDNNTLIVSCGLYGEVRFWNLRHMSPIYRLQVSMQRLRGSCMMMISDKYFLATCGEESLVRIWDTTTILNHPESAVLAHPQIISAMDVEVFHGHASVHGQDLLVVAYSTGWLYGWDVDSGDCTLRIKLSESIIYADLLSIADDSQVLAFATREGMVRASYLTNLSEPLFAKQYGCAILGLAMGLEKENEFIIAIASHQQIHTVRIDKVQKEDSIIPMAQSISSIKSVRLPSGGARMLVHHQCEAISLVQMSDGRIVFQSETSISSSRLSQLWYIQNHCIESCLVFVSGQSFQHEVIDIQSGKSLWQTSQARMWPGYGASDVVGMLANYDMGGWVCLWSVHSRRLLLRIRHTRFLPKVVYLFPSRDHSIRLVLLGALGQMQIWWIDKSVGQEWMEEFKPSARSECILAETLNGYRFEKDAVLGQRLRSVSKLLFQSASNSITFTPMDVRSVRGATTSELRQFFRIGAIHDSPEFLEYCKDEPPTKEQSVFCAHFHSSFGHPSTPQLLEGKISGTGESSVAFAFAQDQDSELYAEHLCNAQDIVSLYRAAEKGCTAALYRLQMMSHGGHEEVETLHLRPLDCDLIHKAVLATIRLGQSGRGASLDRCSMDVLAVMASILAHGNPRECDFERLYAIANKGSKDAFNSLCFFARLQGVVHDDYECSYTRLCHPSAARYVSRCLVSGRAVARDLPAAYAWEWRVCPEDLQPLYRLVALARQGSVQAYSTIRMLANERIIVHQHHRRSVRRRFPDAAREMARCLWFGWGVQESHEEARRVCARFGLFVASLFT